MLTREEKQALTHLLDLATKAGGLQVIQGVMYFVAKFELNQPSKKEVKEPE
jgi:hypothetical protein